MMMTREFITEYFKLADEQIISKLSEYATTRKVERGDLIFQSGCILSHVVFLLRGMFRGYSVDYDGKEETDFLYVECGDILLPAYGIEQTAAWNIEALADSEILLFPVKKVAELAKQNFELLYVYNKLLRESSKKNSQNKNLLLRKNGFERYVWFEENYPGLIEAVNNSYIASFLGISPVTLSRARGLMRDLNSKK